MDADRIEADQYQKIREQNDKITELAIKLGELSSGVQEANGHIAQLIELLKKALLYMFIIILLLIGAVIYGALGEKGFNAVTEKMKSRAPIVSWHGDDNKWAYERSSV